jgi:hypothetical protein
MSPARRWKVLGEVYVAPPPAPSLRSFGLTVGTVFVLIAVFSGWRGHPLRAQLAGVLGALLIVAGLAKPAVLAVVARLWGRLGHALGWFNSRVLLTLMFGLVLIPVGFVSRLFGSDPLDQRRRSASLWIEYPARSRDSKHYERMF